MRSWIKNAWFLLALVMLLTIGVWQAPALAGWARAFPRFWLIAAIMFVTALPIDFARVTRARGAWGAVGLATLLSIVAAPLLGGLAAIVAPASLAIGMVVATASPCTLASAAVWTRRGGGNDAVAVLVTLITNLSCFVVLPFWAWALLGESVEADFASLTVKLLACVAAPIVLAQLARRVPMVLSQAKQHGPLLSIAAQCGVLTMAFIGAIQAGAMLRAMTTPISAGDWVIVILATAVAHVVLLAGGWKLAQLARMPKPEALAVAIAGSQKTLAIGVGIALEFGGLAIFPMIVYHIGQLLIDTVFVDRVREAK